MLVARMRLESIPSPVQIFREVTVVVETVLVAAPLPLFLPALRILFILVGFVLSGRTLS
jgi:hypothetical protein